MSRPLSLTDSQVLAIQREYQRQKGRRGVIASLARQYGVSRWTIDRALTQYVAKPSHSVNDDGAFSGEEIDSGTPGAGRGFATVRDKSERDRLGYLKWCQVEGCGRQHVGFGKCEYHYGRNVPFVSPS